jgi:hypothetical protein
MNKVFYVSMVKNEIDILPYLYSHLLDEELDGFFVADNLSTDGTRDFLSEFATQNKNVHIVDDPEVAYYQSQKMNRLILQAVDLGATHIIAADGDEFWYPIDRSLSLGQTIREMSCDVAIAPVYDMVPKDKVSDPILDIVYREPAIKALPSVAFRWVPGAQVTMGNHDVYHSTNRNYELIAIRHFQYRSFEQFKNKLRNGKMAYDATELDGGVGSHWRIGGSRSDQELKFLWDTFVNQTNLVYDPTPIRNGESK